MTKIYSHLFFDLDHTLWDYDRNVRESLSELFQLYDLVHYGIPGFDAFFDAFEQVNYELWDLYNVGAVTKEMLRFRRFRTIFERFGLDPNQVPPEMETDFLTRTSSKPHVFPDTFPVLDYLAKKYPMHIITNGFDESQGMKLNSAGLAVYFRLVVTSETMGYRKPDRRIFEYALSALGTRPHECLMIGDNPQSDILGAQNAGIDQVFFNPKDRNSEVVPTYVVKSMTELKDIL
jgi:putative hydrolase of the HAD superfamily